jgi:putative transcriptional regulator
MPPMEAPFQLEAPLLLVAMPQVLDPFFHRSVVLLVHHDAEGSLGFIINRTTAISVREILEGMDISWQGDRQTLAGFGGPVQPQVGTVLFAARKVQPHSAQICPGVRLTQHMTDLCTLAADPPRDFRLLLGYAGWGAGQLEDELLRHDWITARAAPALVFTSDPEEIWERTLRSVGIDPAALPSWSPPVDDGTAN